LEEEKVAALLEGSRAPFDGGTLNVQGNGRAYRQGEPIGPPMLSLSIEHFNRMARLADRGVPVEVEMNVKTTFHQNNGDNNGYNVIAEIPGSDPQLKDQVVMLGAHLDSWHAATGATDNAAGSSVMMEAMRILKAAGLKPRRTIRMALWTGEEQGLFGSTGYVKEHFAVRKVREDGEYANMPSGDRPLISMQLKPEHAKISAYFNVDSGTGKIRGISLQENQALEPIFRQWIEPLKDLGMTVTSMRSTGGSDFLSFDQVGIPGVDFEQDAIEYDTRTHHTNMDTLDRIQRDDMLQAAAIVASFVYNAAMRDQLLPRKPLPQPEPEAPKPAETSTEQK
jgi:Zn-dependent M28 family amino/carboxypeptidase